MLILQIYYLANIYISCLYSNKLDEKLKKRFKRKFKFSDNDTNKCILLLRKGVYSYEYII